MAEQTPGTATYSPKWFETFCAGVDPAQTAREVEFLKRAFPRPAHRKLLDVGCGMGRHAHPLAQSGYEVTGLENSPVAMRSARQLCDRAVRLIPGDMRDMSALETDFDGVVCLWSTFGVFPADENAEVLRSMSTRLRPRGRLVLDVYDPAFFKPGRTERVHHRDGVQVIEVATVESGRRHVLLTYNDEQHDEFGWQLLSVAEMRILAARFELRLCHACAAFDETREAAGQEPRMQLVFERLADAT